jgi:hypothetical protein
VNHGLAFQFSISRLSPFESLATSHIDLGRPVVAAPPATSFLVLELSFALADEHGCSDIRSGLMIPLRHLLFLAATVTVTL